VASSLRSRPFGRRSFDAMPDQHEVFKFFPTAPPRRGEHVLVDGVRCRVTTARVSWEGRTWTLRKLRVKESPLG
jgi:hypothetical protein